jgi:hypothetical protein
MLAPNEARRIAVNVIGGCSSLFGSASRLRGCLKNFVSESFAASSRN